MSRKVQMIIAIVICAVVWIGGVYYLYDSYKTGDVRVSGNIVTVAREMDVRDGKVVGEKNFVEAKAGQVALLSIACGVVGLIFIARTFKSPPQNSVRK